MASESTACQAQEKEREEVEELPVAGLLKQKAEKQNPVEETWHLKKKADREQPAERQTRAPQWQLELRWTT